MRLGTIRGLLDFVIVTGPMKADSVITFLRRLTKISTQSVILDNAANHRANHVKETQGITSLMYLPPYSPDLAPTELFFRVFRAKFHRVCHTNCRTTLDSVLQTEVDLSANWEPSFRNCWD